LLPSGHKLVFETDAGSLEIELDPSVAPVAATRLADLARAGFFNGVAVHRVVPGFVVQLGDPGGDGYGGAKGPPLRCETAPVPFENGTVGIALGGRDTGSSQFFVTLGRYPHLDGEYAVVGRAGPGWDRVTVGDVVNKARVE
jgi:cyclophilin family peptidyl-prolyl cis-trans isomerase